MKQQNIKQDNISKRLIQESYRVKANMNILNQEIQELKGIINEYKDKNDQPDEPIKKSRIRKTLQDQFQFFNPQQTEIKRQKFGSFSHRFFNRYDEDQQQSRKNSELTPRDLNRLSQIVYDNNSIKLQQQQIEQQTHQKNTQSLNLQPSNQMLSRLIQINGNREDLLLKHIKDDENYRKLIQWNHQHLKIKIPEQLNTNASIKKVINTNDNRHLLDRNPLSNAYYQYHSSDKQTQKKIKFKIKTINPYKIQYITD